ncbi:hypothetical protein [Mucilaginibacter sp. 10I4]|uniref:hypothetical protein n=1 Tax=Mucilaginibacter sp. 10I4 TaxID=3048580 RepID=UPI002B22908F|nr:hypothetical protein [Mucilaginibacter sp. 10I4]MEB0262883.1 hypothetical protein [Mucilaginibacter sp. 10I4]
MARSRVMLYSFKESSGKVILDYTLTRWLVDYDNHHAEILQINLPNGQISISKLAYLNTGKVYFDGKYFFIVATKWMGKKQALKFLLSFACERIETRLTIYKKLLAA